MPAALLAAASRPVPARARPFDVALFPRGTRLVSQRAIEWRPGQDISNYWASFRRRYGKDGWAAVSDVLFANAETEALVYYEGHCGGLCGEGGYVWLHRDAATQQWAIRKKVISWVN